jgi:hypothetical protein
MSRPWLPAAACAALLAAAPPAATAGEVADAVIVLETAPGTPGSVAEGAPLRFVLLKDGQAFTGGTSAIETVRLERGEASALRRRADAARKALDRASRDGASEGRTFSLRLGEEPPVQLTLPAEAAAARPGAAAGDAPTAFVRELLAFHHPGLSPFAPASYALRLREGSLSGGCRPWTFPFPLAEALESARVVPAETAAGWPTGGFPASVCGPGGKQYVLTLRPLLPGEQP